MDSELRRLRAENGKLKAQLVEARQTLEALAEGQVDTVTMTGSDTPILLRAAQDKLLASKRLLRAVFDGSLDGIVLADDAGRYTDANPAACALHGTTRDELLGHTPADFSASRELSLARWEKLLQDGAMEGNLPLVRPDGSRLDIDFRARAHILPGVHLCVLRDVTAQRATSDALRRSEEMLVTSFRLSPIALGISTVPEGRFLDVNDATATLAGRTRDEMLGRTSAELDFWADPTHRARLIEALGKGTGVRAFPTRVRARGGEIREVLLSAELISLRGQTCLLGVMVDVTDRDRADRTLREGQRLLEEAQAIAHVGSWTSGLDLDDEIAWSRECARIFGLPNDVRLTVRSLFERVHPGDREALRRAERDAIERGTSLDVEHRVERPDGRTCWVHARATVERATGRPPRMVGIVQDITDRRVASDALRASEDRYRRIVEGTSEGVLTSDESGRLTFVNQRFADMLGYAREEMVGEPLFRFIHPLAQDLARQKFEARRKGGADAYELLFQRRDGGGVWTFAKGSPLRDANGRLEGTLGLITDMTEVRGAIETRNRLAAIVEQSDAAIIGTDLAGVIATWNKAAEVLFGYEPAESVGKSVLMLAPEDIVAAERPVIAALASGKAIHQYETQRQRKDGTLVDVSLSASPIRDANGAVVGAAYMLRDQTERRKAEAALRRTEDQLHQAQKMESIGTLAGGLAHDFNNLLTVILTCSSLVLSDLRAGDPMRADLEDIAEAGRRASELTRQLLAFGRQQVLEPRILDLTQVLVDIRRMLERTVREDVAISIDAGDSLGKVFVDPGQIEQIALNLAANARDAMPDGGKLAFETSNVVLDEGYAAEHPGITPGPYVMLAVSDTGTGMDAPTKARIFEPFFSTKDRTRGSGLGLSTVFGIVRQSGGHIYVYSEIGIGTTFKIYLPRSDREESPSAAIHADPTLLRGTETVLVVEDEENVRRMLLAILRRQGYTVLEAPNGGEALLICEEYAGKIDLLLTDIVMPRLGGRKLAERLAPLRPLMKILFVSGYTQNTIVRDGVLEAGVSFLQKPVTPESLARKVREVLDAPLVTSV